ncbi:MAG TPA: amino acid ABC transporter permease [Paralcaligenes sp.]
MGHIIEILSNYGDFLLRGVLLTLQASFLGSVFALIFGILIGIARVYGGKRLSAVLGVPVDIFRAIPLLVIVIWTFYALPVFLNVFLTPMIAGVLSLTVRYAATISEAVRGGILSIAPGQALAGSALGITKSRVIVRIVLPQALIRMIPPVTSQIVSLVKNSSLLYVIAVTELMRQAETLNAQLAQPLAIFTIIAGIYFVIAYPITVISEIIYKRLYSRAAN